MAQQTPARSPLSAYTVGEFAILAGVSVRTLHHYDAIGLLSPSGRTDAGYRLYGHEELEQLQQILLYRELDLPLDAIARIMVDPGFDRRAALVTQRAQLAARAGRMEAILAAIDAALDALAKGEPMRDADMFEVFGDFDPTSTNPRSGSAGVRRMPTRSRPVEPRATPRTTGSGSRPRAMP